MKKIISIILAICLFSCLSVNVFAIPTNNYTSAPITATANISTPTYTIMIPEKINFGEQKQALLKYKNSKKDQYGKDIKVSVSLQIYAENITNLFDDLGKKPQLDVLATFSGLLEDEDGNKIPYTITGIDNNEITSGNVFSSFKNSSEVEGNQLAIGNVWVNRTDIKKIGSYSGTMTFTINIPDAE